MFIENKEEFLKSARYVDSHCPKCKSENIDIPGRIEVVKIRGGGRFERYDFYCKEIDCNSGLTMIHNVVCQCGFFDMQCILESSSEGRGGYFEYRTYWCSKCGYVIIYDGGDWNGFVHDRIKNED